MTDRIHKHRLAALCLLAVAGLAQAADVQPTSQDDWASLLPAGRDACALAGTDLAAADQGLSPAPAHTPSSRLGPFSACFAPGTPDEVMARVDQMMIDAWMAEGGGFGERYNTSTRWAGTGFGTTGDPITLYWSFVPDGLTISGGTGEPASPSNLFATMDARAARATWILQFQRIFDRWRDLTGLNYTRITVGGNDWDDNAAWGSAYSANLRGHVRIAMHLIDGASNILAYTYYPQNGDMVFDTGDAASYGGSGNQYRFLRNTAAHEHGHGIGLAHECSADSLQLMEPFLSTQFDGPRQDDIRGAQRFYGDINEPDNTFATAVLAGNLGINTITLGTPPVPVSGASDTFSSTLSIDANGEVDFHRVATTGILLANFTVTPVGSTYDDGDQSSTTGACLDGPQLNAMAVANLAFDVLASNGSTLILSGNVQAVGLAETVSGVLLSPPGNFYLKVYEVDAPTQVQFYKATIVGTATPTMAASDGTFNDKVQVTCTNIPGATSYAILRNIVNDQATAVQVATSATNTIDDITAVPQQSYFYWAQAVQGAAGVYRDVAGPDTGFRGGVSNPPGAFNLSTPADGSIDMSKTPTLVWTASSDASTYTLTIDDSSDLASPISTVPGLVTTSYDVPAGLLNDCTTYYWGVTAVNGVGSTASTPVSFSFTTRFPADFNHDGFVDGIDYDAFNNAFEAGDPAADFNGDGFVDGIDYDEFNNHFEAGC
jgi:hypothetical protein